MESRDRPSSSRRPSKRVRITATLPHIPDEIILEILCLLPVKSLMRFKCVSKSWREMISDPDFEKKQLAVAARDSGEVYNSRLIMHYPSMKLKSCPLSCLFYEPVGHSVNHEYPGSELGAMNEIIGSYNGLVCFCIRDTENDIIFVWNPSTREFRRLPPISFMQCFHLVAYGFGYDSIADDYKVTRVGCYCIGRYYEYQVRVFSLRGNVWRKIENFPCYLFTDEPGIHVNGSINFGGVGDSENYYWSVVGLDLASESYRMVPLPDCADPNVKPMIMALGGRFCTIFDNDEAVDVWVMEQYGVKKSWNKLVTVPYFPDPMTVDCTKPVFFLRDGAILMEFYGLLVLYNIDRDESTIPTIYGTRHCHEVEVYLETIVSPNAYYRLQAGHQNGGIGRQGNKNFLMIFFAGY
ncbi:F-box/kelch-repeat protein [Vitis vinifera]|uniref:F-box/kelch-repeat protein n=1 Tax=Vitis vinifera TaxID=29760 RepID=A0A438BMN2_VITVI|nr:F-box/kelch-repeat protein [Vitis vinifera]